MKEEMKLSTGIQGLDEKIGGGLPTGGIGISVVGHPGVGKRVMCMQMLYEGLKRGKPGVYVSMDSPYFEIRKKFYELGMDVAEYERKDKFIIVDCTGIKPEGQENIKNIVFVSPSDGVEKYKDACLTVKKERLGIGGVDVIDNINSSMEFIGNISEAVKIEREFRIEIGLKMKTIGLHIVDLGTSLDGEVSKIFSFDKALILFEENEPFNLIKIKGFPGVPDTGWINYKMGGKGIELIDDKSLKNKTKRTKIANTTSVDRIAISSSLFFIVVMLIIALFVKNPTAFQFFVFRVIISLAAGGFGAALPGFMYLDLPIWKKGAIRASGALGLFVLVYLINPAGLVWTDQ